MSGVKGGRLVFADVNERNIGAVRKLLETVLPVRYSDGFYKDMIRTPPQYCRMAYFNELFVGFISCRLEPRPDGKKRLHVTTFAVLAPYRGLGIGTSLLRELESAFTSDPDMVEVYLHVQEGNDEAVRLYSKFGFAAVGECPGYYTRVEPANATLLRRMLDESVEPSVEAGRGGTDSNVVEEA